MRWLRALPLLVVWFARAASADAVPPPPVQCPPGTVGVTDHGGPRCEKVAPTNCPNGWFGVVGGRCVLHQCTEDAQCSHVGKVCRPATLCFEPRTRSSTCGALEVPRGSELGVPRVLGEPCAQLPEPVTDWVAVNVCGASRACASPSECRPGSLCVTPTAPPPGPEPNGGSPPSSNGFAQPPPNGGMQPRPSGCGSGCAGSPASGISGALFSIGALALWSARRRERGQRAT